MHHHIAVYPPITGVIARSEAITADAPRMKVLMIENLLNVSTQPSNRSQLHIEIENLNL